MNSSMTPSAAQFRDTVPSLYRDDPHFWVSLYLNQVVEGIRDSQRELAGEREAALQLQVSF